MKPPHARSATAWPLALVGCGGLIAAGLSFSGVSRGAYLVMQVDGKFTSTHAYPASVPAARRLAQWHGDMTDIVDQR